MFRVNLSVSVMPLMVQQSLLMCRACFVTMDTYVNKSHPLLCAWITHWSQGKVLTGYENMIIQPYYEEEKKGGWLKFFYLHFKYHMEQELFLLNSALEACCHTITYVLCYAIRL